MRRHYLARNRRAAVCRLESAQRLDIGPHTQPKRSKVMNDIETLVRSYLASWNEHDPVRRRSAIEAVFAPDAGYTDPNHVLNGRAEIDGAIAAVHGMERFAGHTFELGSTVDSHHDTARFAWHLVPPGGMEPVVIGFDVAVIEEGRIRQVYGFLDKVPA
jgi:hypothetical protein